jgi:subtilisin family serine protease
MEKRYQLALLLTLSISLFSCSEQFTELNVTQEANLDDNLVKPNLRQAELSIDKDSYIVVFNESTSEKEIDDEVDDLDKKEKIRADDVFKSALKGYSARLSPAALAKLKKNPKVAFIEKNQVMSINAVTISNPTWGLDRIDQTKLPLSTSYTYTSNGTGVDAYIIDTGILLNHVDFAGRAIGGYSAIGTATNYVDQNGHGTHVAGIVGGSTYGVAKNINLIAVRVLDATGGGSTAGVIKGVDWVTSHHATRPAVANMSLGGGASAALDLAVSNAIKDGVVMCVAAGNSSVDAGRSSPARVAAAITVGATGAYPSLGSNYDVFAAYSNYGSVIDVFAPGTSIMSAYIPNNTSTAVLSGTSMATPYVAGAVGKYLSVNVNSTPAQVSTFIKSSSTKNVITGLRGKTVNALLYTNF